MVGVDMLTRYTVYCFQDQDARILVSLFFSVELHFYSDLQNDCWLNFVLSFLEIWYQSNNNNNKNNSNNNNNNNFIFRGLLWSFTYTRKSYLKKAFVNKHDIINHTQTKLIIHV